jgi:cytochrome c peroxidase
LVAPGIEWKELDTLPGNRFATNDSMREKINLGKILFFDPRLSSSGKISCSSCHQPQLSWTDGKARSIGHEGARNKRNAPTIQNSWFYKRLFWDGRARDLEDQAFAPINSESEMHSEMPDVIVKVRNSTAYRDLFKKAFGDEQVDPDRLAAAIAAFERSISSGKSRFDEFLAGNKNALSDLELEGLHAFRTSAGCMNCHHGPLFSDNQFHNTGFFGSAEEGLYNVTHREEDKGKFKTPSLRDVMYTGPWMHDGSFAYLEEIISLYRKGPPSPGGLLKSFSTKHEVTLVAFLKAISAPPKKFEIPVLPG